MRHARRRGLLAFPSARPWAPLCSGHSCAAPAKALLVELDSVARGISSSSPPCGCPAESSLICNIHAFEAVSCRSA